ncbi:MAG: hypothetical protein ACYDCL_07605 [Myxococcales bacterium]
MKRSGPFAAASLALLSACTSASIYETSGAGQEGPDRTMLEGTVCAPLATGTEFPVKIVFAVEGGSPPVQTADTAEIVTALQGAEAAAPPGSQFALIGFHTVALAFTKGFVSGADLDQTLPQLQGSTAQQTGPVSLQAPLDLADAIISGDMQTSCSATVRRTHYYVMLLLASSDVTCTDPAFSTALQSICNTNNNDPLQSDRSSPYCTCINGGTATCDCECCILSTAASNLKALGATYGGAVSVVPIYFRDTTGEDPTIAQQIQDIVAASGAQPEVLQTNGVPQLLSGYGFSTLLSAPVLSRLYAWNRNVVARDGQELVDSDGDGVPDEDEVNIFHSNPLLASSAPDGGDGISDGLKVHLGLDPNAPLALGNCPCAGQPDSCLDTDFDGLNDCEEQVLQTDPCAGDTDGDGLSDLVELHSGTNPLVPEANQDSDGDGVSNAIEVMTHSDPNSADLTFRAARAVWASVSPGTPTPDGRPCYDFQIGNISLMATQARQEGFQNIPAGANTIYLMAEWSYQGGAEIGQFFPKQVIYAPPAQPSPPSPILITPDELVEGT